MKVTVKGQGPVTLSQSHFVAMGGQASVYVKDGTAYKIYTDPKTAIPEAKFQALAAIQDSAVVRPEALLVDDKHQPIGYTMRAVKDSHALCQLFTRAFRDRNKVTPDQIVGIAERLQEHIRHVHQAQVLIVDLNELNLLVPQSLDDTFLIDVDSYQTRGFPATVIMPSVRDYSVSAKDFSELSDWFSYAVLAFQLFVGAHPYRGTHPGSASVPRDEQLVHRMKGHLSAFRSDVRLPKCCYPLDSIPEGLRGWLRAVLDDGKRLPPPSALGAIAAPLASAPAPMRVPGGLLTIQEHWNSEGWTVLGYEEIAMQPLALTTLSHRIRVTLGSRTLWDVQHVGGKNLVGSTPKLSRPIVLNLLGDRVSFHDLTHNTGEQLSFRADELTKSGDRFYIRSGTQVLEIEFSELKDKTLVTASHVVANVMESASKLYEGCAIQSMLGSVFVSLFPRHHVGYQVRIAELDGYKIVDAKADGTVLMVLAAKNGHYDRMVFRFTEEYDRYDLRRVADVTPTGINFVTLATGICVCITEEEKLEAFPGRWGAQSMKLVEDPAIGSDMRLLKVSGKAGFERGGKLYTLGLK